MDAPGFWPLFAVRLVALSAVLVLCGTAAWASLIRFTPPPRRDRLANLALTAAVCLFAARILELLAQTWALFSPDPVGVGELRTVATATTWGAGWQVQTVVAALAVGAALLCRRGGHGPWSVLGVIALVGALSAPLTGHAVERGWWTLPYFLQALHVLGAGLWVGSLAVLTTAAWRREPDHAAVARRVRRFSPLALTGAALLGVTGTATAWLYMARPADLWETAWGRALLLKLALLAVVAALGHHNWQRVRPRLGSPDATYRLRRSTAAELLFATLLLAVTALLVALPMPAEM